MVTLQSQATSLKKSSLYTIGLSLLMATANAVQANAVQVNTNTAQAKSGNTAQAKRGIIDVDCSGTYLKVDGKDYLVCKPGQLKKHDNRVVDARFTKVSRCPPVGTPVCQLYHANSGSININSWKLSTSASSADLLQGSWKITRMKVNVGKNASSFEELNLDGRNLTLSFNAGRVTGKVCNAIWSNYTIKGLISSNGSMPYVKTAGFSSTKMVCQDQLLNEVETGLKAGFKAGYQVVSINEGVGYYLQGKSSTLKIERQQ